MDLCQRPTPDYYLSVEDQPSQDGEPSQDDKTSQVKEPGVNASTMLPFNQWVNVWEFPLSYEFGLLYEASRLHTPSIQWSRLRLQIALQSGRSWFGGN